ncbi:hypothetical protein [Lacisediminimonas profundi]|uniref:hypothetical protein n=1 Tax=Lacisediminimonas profundi TaxID=2603856 RepID=UPI0019D53492|nr:hypothetical protein [Lacisediminimonas profundi]
MSATLILPLVLWGCASHTGVVSMGQDTFMIAKQQATGFPGPGNMKGEIIAEGSAHCSSQGKSFRILNMQESQPPYILGNYPRSEIQFMCIPKDDPDHQRPKLVQSPNGIIEQKK